MKTFLSKVVVVLSILLLCVGNTTAQKLKGNIGKSPQWGSAWIDLRKITDFREGDTLRLKLGGTAKKVLVRLLPKDEDAGSSSGIEGDARKVPANGIMTVVLESDHPQVKQISVHGGPNPWGLGSLGEDNGPVTLYWVELRSYHPHQTNK